MRFATAKNSGPDTRYASTPSGRLARWSGASARPKSSTSSSMRSTSDSIDTTSLIRYMNRNAAITRPTCTATVRSETTVSTKVTTSTMRSPGGERRSWRMRSISLMFHATISSNAAIAGNGT